LLENEKGRIVVFGGGGFMGSAIVERLLRDGYFIRVFEHPRAKPYRTFQPSERLEWFSGDMSRSHEVLQAVSDMEAVIHLVSFTVPKSSNEDMAYDVQTNLIASLQLLNAMVARQVRKIVFVSSGGTVYGVPHYNSPIDEQHPTAPLVSYGITKLAIEKYLLLFQHLHGIKPVILRVANAYGPRQRPETAQGAAGIFLYRALSGLPLEIWGDGSVVRDYVYTDDVADAFSRALGYEGRHNVFNIGSGTGTSLNALVDEIENVTGRKVTRKYMEKRRFDLPYNVLDNTLAQEELGWSPSTTLQDGLRNTAAWLESQPG